MIDCPNCIGNTGIPFQYPDGQVCPLCKGKFRVKGNKKFVCKKPIDDKSITMYLIQRKADGKYWINKDFHSCHTWGNDEQREQNWTDNKAKCRPFKSISGAKASRGWSKYKQVPSNKPCRLCQSGEELSQDYYAHWETVDITDENELKCRVIAVKVSIR